MEFLPEVPDVRSCQFGCRPVCRDGEHPDQSQRVLAALQRNIKGMRISESFHRQLSALSSQTDHPVHAANRGPEGIPTADWTTPWCLLPRNRDESLLVVPWGLNHRKTKDMMAIVLNLHFITEPLCATEHAITC